MYKCFFESDNGKTYNFGTDGRTVFDMNLGEGVSVDLGTSQGFQQIGETVESQSVLGRDIEVKGIIYDDVSQRRKQLRSVFAPFTAGKLVFDGKHYIRVFVKESPSFSPIKNDGRFTMFLFAPFPFFYNVNKTTESVGKTVATFSFPINFAEPHSFGTTDKSQAVMVYNGGDVAVPFEFFLKNNGAVLSGVSLKNSTTGEILTIDAALAHLDEMRLFKNENGVVRLERIAVSAGVTEPIDITSSIGEESTFFSLARGENLISISASGEDFIATISFNEAVVAVYED